MDQPIGFCCVNAKVKFGGKSVVVYGPIMRLKAVALQNEVLNAHFVKRSDFAGNELLLWYGDT